MYYKSLICGRRIVETIQEAEQLTINIMQDFQPFAVGPDKKKQNRQAKLKKQSGNIYLGYLVQTPKTIQKE